MTTCLFGTMANSCISVAVCRPCSSQVSHPFQPHLPTAFIQTLILMHMVIGFTPPRLGYPPPPSYVVPLFFPLGRQQEEKLMPLTSVLFFSLCFPLFCCYFLLFHVFCCCHLTASAEPPDTPLDVRDSQADLQPVKYDSEQGSEKVSQPPPWAKTVAHQMHPILLPRLVCF